MLTEILLAQIGEPVFNRIIADIIATLAILTYVMTLYPSISREVFSRRSIKVLVQYRPQIGIISCLLGFIHAVPQLFSSEKYYMNLLNTFHHSISGLICLIIFVMLGITSNRWMQKKLKKNWKRLHSLTYILPILLIWHILAKVTDWNMFTQLCFLMLISATSLLALRFSKRVFSW